VNWNILITLGKKIKREYIKIPGKVRLLLINIIINQSKVKWIKNLFE